LPENEVTNICSTTKERMATFGVDVKSAGKYFILFSLVEIHNINV